MSWYDDWRDALLRPGGEVPDGLSSWNGSDPAQRFAIYRNNVLVSLRDALADTFPALRDHLGHETFSDLALDYLCQHPPQSAILAHYGESFPGWLSEQTQWQLPNWCVEMARLERAYINSFHAADAAVPSLSDWQHLLEDEELLARCQPRLHPALQLIDVQYEILPLWAASQNAARCGRPLDHQGRLPDPQQRAHTLCVIREDEGVAVIELSASSAIALNGIASGLSLQEALVQVDDEQLRIEMLAYWIQLPLFSALEVAA